MRDRERGKPSARSTRAPSVMKTPCDPEDGFPGRLRRVYTFAQHVGGSAPRPPRSTEPSTVTVADDVLTLWAGIDPPSLTSP